jgi:folate-dependent phosphoribosylglycinamide formyltransferase PurN
MSKPRLIVFASGSASGGGSGFEKLVVATHEGILNADIIAVVSNYENGGVRSRAENLQIPFVYFPQPWVKEKYEEIVRGLAFDFIALSGWLKLVSGLDPRITFNIHPGPLPDFGGPGMYGHHVHEAVLKAYRDGVITHSAVSMHFVTSEYDRGPVFFRMPVEIFSGDTADDIGTRVNQAEHQWQPRITNLVVNGEISWDGNNPSSLRIPGDYQFV